MCVCVCVGVGGKLLFKKVNFLQNRRLQETLYNKNEY